MLLFAIAISHLVKVKTYGRNNNFWIDTVPTVSSFPIGSLAVVLNHMPFKSNMFFKIAKRLFKGCGEIVKFVYGSQICLALL